MNILAIDYGKKRIGLAWVDTAIGVVLPYGVIESQNEKGKSEKIIDLIRNEKTDRVVIGLPLGLSGEESEMSKQVQIFTEQLKSHISCPIDLVDERFSSAEAKRMGGDASPDEKAAMLILQTYFEQLKHKK